ncbi:hypothetical protein OIO90_003919 [Microbotryomycetes sp. JL221]|nr:hypothetical protein OIO90_003919 [Microbotryomycetes sp. JL221]
MDACDQGEDLVPATLYNKLDDGLESVDETFVTSLEEFLDFGRDEWMDPTRIGRTLAYQNADEIVMLARRFFHVVEELRFVLSNTYLTAFDYFLVRLSDSVFGLVSTRLMLKLKKLMIEFNDSDWTRIHRENPSRAMSVFGRFATQRIKIVNVDDVKSFEEFQTMLIQEENMDNSADK